MSWLWLAVLLAGPPPPGERPVAAAPAEDEDGGEALLLAAWPADRRPRSPAVRVDARAIDPGGAPGRVSLALAPPRVRIPFDDPAVQGARRRALAGPPRRALSTLLRGDSVFAGALTGLPDGEPWGVVDDPFALVFPARRLRVGAGLVGVMAAPAGPVIERYGSGSPWPWDRFA